MLRVADFKSTTDETISDKISGFDGKDVGSMGSAEKRIFRKSSSSEIPYGSKKVFSNKVARASRNRSTAVTQDFHPKIRT